MELFMDFGNSAVKWATGEALAVDGMYRTPYGDSLSSLTTRLEALARPSRVVIATVLHRERLSELCAWMEAQWGVMPSFAQTRTAELGVVNGYSDPERLGVDRWLGLLAGRALSERPQLVVDCGTATTLDAMDGDGRHLGGVILPGLALFGRCLHAQTDLPDGEEDAAVVEFATDTASGIASGAMLATVASIETMRRRLTATCGEGVDCFLTGGFASRVTNHLVLPHRVVPHLILQGLSLQAGQEHRQ